MNRMADRIFQDESATKISRFSQPNRALVHSNIAREHETKLWSYTNFTKGYRVVLTPNIYITALAPRIRIEAITYANTLCGDRSRSDERPPGYPTVPRARAELSSLLLPHSLTQQFQ